MLTAFKASEVSQVSRIELDPSGHPYLTVVIPEIKYQGLPDLGWSLAVHKDVDVAFLSMRGLFRLFWLALAAGMIVTLGGVYLLIRRAAGPIEATARFAAQLAAGEYGAEPPKIPGCREPKDTCLALIQLQSRLRGCAGVS